MKKKVKMKKYIETDKLIKYIETLPKNPNGTSKVYDEASIIRFIEAVAEEQDDIHDVTVTFEKEIRW